MIHALPQSVRLTLKKEKDKNRGRKGLDGDLTGVYDP